MAQTTKYDDLVNLARELQRCERASLKAMAARAALPAGSSRARVTSANARWRLTAEARDRALKALREVLSGSTVCPTLSEIAARSPARDPEGVSVFVGSRLLISSDVAWDALDGAKLL